MREVVETLMRNAHEAKMREIVETLTRNAHEVQFGTVSVELRIHGGKVVKTIYRTEKTDVERNRPTKTQTEDQNG